MSIVNSYIMPMRLNNEAKKFIKFNCNTTDNVYLDSSKEVESMPILSRITYPTDYAVANGAMQGASGAVRYWLRDAGPDKSCKFIDIDGEIGSSYCDVDYITLPPSIALDVSQVLIAKNSSQLTSNNYRLADGQLDIDYTNHTITFGYVPQTYVGDTLNAVFERNFENLKNTGKTYVCRNTDIGKLKGEFVPMVANEVEYKGERYVRVLVEAYDKDSKYQDGSKPTNGEYQWFKVEPIVWRIRNWNSLPTGINRNGKDAVNYMDLRTVKSIATLPFYPCEFDANSTLWQNSSPRGYLNGYNVENITTNGNIALKAPRGGDFSNYNFLKEAFDFEMIVKKVAGAENKVEESSTPKVSWPTVETKKDSNPFGFVFDELSNDELLAEYVKSRTPVFLHGTSGVGKSATAERIDPTCVRLTLRPMQPSEEVDGILNRETGEYFPPLWFTKLKEKCEKEPDRMHVLFIDELTNVSPTVQSLIYTIVYDREGKDGLWPLPENSVVIAAGNEEDGNKAAYPLTNALFRRFAHLYYEVDVDRWVDWATSINTNEVSVYNRINKDDKTKRAKIHPALLAYVKSRGKDVLNQPLDEDNPSIVTDPRKWEMASNVLYSTNNPYSLKPCIGEELTKDFVSFVKTAQLTVEDILNDSFSADKLMLMSLSEKYSSLLNLSLVDEDNLPKIRNVISQCFGGELRSVFDLMWIRNDPERALILADLNSSMEA